MDYHYAGSEKEYKRMAKRAAAKGRWPKHMLMRERIDGTDKRKLRRRARHKATEMGRDRECKSDLSHMEEAEPPEWRPDPEPTSQPPPKTTSSSQPWFVREDFLTVYHRYLKAQIGGHWQAEVYDTNPWQLVRR